MKKTLLLIVIAATSLASSAQLKVTSDGKVKIASNQITSYSSLLVGNNSFLPSSSNAGILGSTTAVAGKTNIGVSGIISADPNITNETNMGVFGLVNPVNNSHGKNYGLCGMIGFDENYYGGAGIYGARYAVYYAHPVSIQGAYAGYFSGDVKVTGNLTLPNMYIPTDSRLSENVVSLNERGEETNTLDNLLAMNVIEYNMKNRIIDEFPDNIGKDATETERKAYECLMKDEMKMSSRRHFGIDAEELQRIYPDLVLEGQDGYLSVNYVELVPVLIRAIQELKAELDAKSEASAPITRAQATTDVGNVSSHGNVLYQNTPNPFNEQTTIRFSLADDARDASICIFDMQGKMLKNLPVSSAMESVFVNGYELGKGMFLYSLVVNGQEIDTKKMVITK